MDIRLTPLEAWRDFWKNVKPEIWEHEIMKTPAGKQMKNELIVANRTAEGNVKKRRKDGSVIVLNLGESRINRLLSYYAPGRYEYLPPSGEGAFILHEK